MYFIYTIILIIGYHHMTYASLTRTYLKDLSDKISKTHRDRRRVQQNVCNERLVATGSSSGEISAPNYPHHYLASNCTWILSAPSGQTLEVEFTSVDIGCRNGDYLRIHDGDDINSPIMLYICGSGTPNAIASSGQHLFIWFYARENSLNNNGFLITFKAVGVPIPNAADACQIPGIQLTQPSGAITSGGFSDFGTGGYEYNLDCRWRIEIQDYYAVLLEFDSFDLEDSLDCRYDRLTIYDGENTSSTQLATLCGRMSPTPIKSTGRYIYIHFETDSSVGGNGFKFSWESLPLSLPNDGMAFGCNAYPALFTGSSGTLTSPYFGGEAKYPPLSRCSYLITGLPGKAIHLAFTTMNLETGWDCPYDWIKVYDGPSDTNDLLAGPLCGTDLPDIPPSSTNQVRIEFVSDLSREYNGFQLNWTQIINNNPCVGGGVTLTAPAGTIASPGFGGESYANSQQCKWRLQAPDNSQILLSWKGMALETHKDCGYDHVKVFDGYDESAKLLGTFCGAELPAALKSSKNFLFLQFISDYSVIKPGFILQYDFGGPGVKNDGSHNGCAGSSARLTGMQGTFTPPIFGGQYSSSSKCAWKITSPPGKVTLLSFSNIDLEYHTKCAWDKLKVYQGSNSDGAELRTVCGKEKDFTVRGQELYVEFTSDATFQRSGFQCSWKQENTESDAEMPIHGLTLTESCGNTFFSLKEERDTQWRIVGGGEANKHSLPWQVVLIQDEFFRCGASILSEKWIITATHCVENIRASRLHIIAGNHALFRLEDSEQRIDVKQKFEHPGYNTPTYDKDITLLELESSLTFNDYVQPLCLPNADLPAGTKCVASGWGDTSYPRGQVASHLQQVYVPLIHHSECSAIYNGTMTDNMICAGNIALGGIDPCFGDSGGPLACLHDGLWQLQGITSWGSGCAERGNPGVYARVTRFLHWIQAITGGMDSV